MKIKMPPFFTSKGIFLSQPIFGNFDVFGVQFYSDVVATALAGD